MIKLAINGYGRIGRAVLRALYEKPQYRAIKLLAINEPADSQAIAHLTQFDSIHGRFAGNVQLDSERLRINDDVIALSHCRQVSEITWGDIDCVLDCSGSVSDRETAQWHLKQGAKSVLLSHPTAEADVDLTVVYGVNHQALGKQHRIVSNASCTTNASVALVQWLEQTFGIDCASITTIHSAMNDQPILDNYHHQDLRRTRSASQSIIPINTGLARGIERFLPELTGRFSAHHIRVPSSNVSALDISVLLKQSVDLTTLNQQLEQWAASSQGIIGTSNIPLASVDFNHDSRSAIIDLTQTQISGERLIKLFVWFDNEWAFANRMIDTAAYLVNLHQ